MIDEFTRAVAYYLSINQDGSIDQIQLQLKSLLPRSAIVDLAQKLSTSEARWDQTGLKKCLRFFSKASQIKSHFEMLLIIMTVTLPLIYLFDFSSYKALTFISKEIVVYFVFSLMVITALVVVKVLSHYSRKLYPLSAKLNKHKLT